VNVESLLLLIRLRDAGLSVRRTDDDMIGAAPVPLLTSEVRFAIAAHRRDLLALLAYEQANAQIQHLLRLAKSGACPLNHSLGNRMNKPHR
jgi:hypothetical protein